VDPARYLYSSARYTYPLVIVPRIMTGEFSLSTESAMISGVIDHTALKQGDSFVDIKSNIGKGRTQDLSARLSLNSKETGIGSSALEMTATWRTSRVTDPLDQSERPLSNQTPLSLNLSFRQSLDREGLSWGVRADNGWQSTTWRINEVSISRATPQVDLFAEFLPVNGLKVRAELNNITRRNISYERFAYDGLRAPDARASESQWSQAQQPFVVLRLLRGL
jgi:outer membrane receptor for ferrienterochelin and colicins